MNEQNNQLLHALTPNLGRASKSVAAMRGRVAKAVVSSSNLIEIVCRFSTLPPAGRYRLVVATRCGRVAEYRVVEAAREVEVR